MYIHVHIQTCSVYCIKLTAAIHYYFCSPGLGIVMMTRTHIVVETGAGRVTVGGVTRTSTTTAIAPGTEGDR